MKEALAKYQPQARAIQEIAVAAVLATCVGGNYGQDFGSCAFKAYRDNVLEAAGQPTDPIEVMLVEQLLLAHHRISDMHTQAVTAKTVEAAALHNAAAARLMAEFRRTSLALREYRTPVVPKNVTVVKQQNLAAGDQQIAYLDGQTATRPGPARNRDSELGSNRQEAIAHERQATFIPQPQASGGRATEPVPARPADASRPGAIAASSTCEPAMGAIYRPENGSGQSSGSSQ
jgi:hypothetical protein